MKLRMNQIALFLVFTMTAFDQAVGAMPMPHTLEDKMIYLGLILVTIIVLGIITILDILLRPK